MARARSAQTQLRVGRLTKAHGLKGALKLELFTDDPDRRFTPGASFALQVPSGSPWHGRRLELVELRWYNGQPVGFFVGVTDRTAAEGLAKAILWVDQDPDEPAEPDAWYDHELIGFDVVRDGEKVGVLDRLEHLPAQDLLVVKVGSDEVLVPFVKALVPEVDVGSRRIVVTPPDGLFETLPDEDPSTPPPADFEDAPSGAEGAPTDVEDAPTSTAEVPAGPAHVPAVEADLPAVEAYVPTGAVDVPTTTQAGATGTADAPTGVEGAADPSPAGDPGAQTDEPRD